MEEKEYEIWTEGFLETGMEGRPAKAYCWGQQKGNSFEEACIKLLGNKLDKDKNQPDGYQKRNGELSVWACKCFDNEMDARKSFG